MISDEEGVTTELFALLSGEEELTIELFIPLIDEGGAVSDSFVVLDNKGGTTASTTTTLDSSVAFVDIEATEPFEADDGGEVMTLRGVVVLPSGSCGGKEDGVRLKAVTVSSFTTVDGADGSTTTTGVGVIWALSTTDIGCGGSMAAATTGTSVFTAEIDTDSRRGMLKM